MPELPEVETVVNYLKAQIESKDISRIIDHKKSIYTFKKPGSSAISVLVKNQRITQIYRRAKYIVFQLDSGLLTIHLRMTGRLLYNQRSSKDKQYILATINFSDGTKLYFRDVRKFGRIAFYTELEDFESSLGVEPLTADLNTKYLQENFQKTSRNIKSVLLDQKIIAGIGNIYADECLWQAKIHPETKACSIPTNNLVALNKAIKSILKKAIEQNGTTFQSFYFDNEMSGNFQTLLKVFGRDSQACRQCKTEIIKIRVAQRGTHLCPRCQQIF